MCGIVGILNLDGCRVEMDAIKSMTDTIIHRGPDGEGHWLGNAIGLGHRRLAIRDLSNAGKQPISDYSGRIHISFNGEIYNDRSLRSELKEIIGYKFRSHCDAEILPAAYLAWGEDMFLK